jgi:hypothetical protein
MFLVALLPSALAFEVGTSYTLGPVPTLTGWLPALDLRTDALLVRIHALEFVGALSDENLLFGGDLFFGKFGRPMGQTWRGVVQPGVGLSVLGDPFTLTVVAEARAGGEMTTDGARLGVAVVPQLGILTGEFDSDLVYGGGVQFSAWFGT